MGIMGNNRIKTSTPMSLEELYERIKDVRFAAGHPLVTRNWTGKAIVFLPVPHNTAQIWITGKNGKFICQCSKVYAGIEKATSDMTYDPAWGKKVDFASSEYAKLSPLSVTAAMAMSDLVTETINSLNL